MPEALALKRLLEERAFAEAARASGPPPLRAAHPEDPASTIYFRLLGTPYAYRGLPGTPKISVGRQRRKPGVPPDIGNDVVIRTPGDPLKSLPISRRHFQIQSLGGQHFVVDHSKGGTQLNGERLISGMPRPIQSGDRLTVAGVMTLEFVVHADRRIGVPLQAPDVGPYLSPGAPLIMEATVGDMVTVEPG